MTQSQPDEPAPQSDPAPQPDEPAPQSDEPAPQSDEPVPQSGRWVPRRRTLVIVGVVLLTVALAVAGLSVFVLHRKPDTASEVVAAFLKAARDGDGEKAASCWKDAGPSTPGGKRPRELVRTYVEQWSAEYKKALTGHKWKMQESDAFLTDSDVPAWKNVLIGKNVEVTVGDRHTTYVVMGESKDWGIAFGPEDWIGQLTGRPHPLFVGS